MVVPVKTLKTKVFGSLGLRYPFRTVTSGQLRVSSSRRGTKPKPNRCNEEGACG